MISILTAPFDLRRVARRSAYVGALVSLKRRIATFAPCVLVADPRA